VFDVSVGNLVDEWSSGLFQATKRSSFSPTAPSVKSPSLTTARMTSRVSFCTSDGDADGLRCLTCQSTALRSTGLPRPSNSSPLSICSRAVLILLTGQFSNRSPVAFRLSQTLAAGRKAVTLPCTHGGFCSALVRIAGARDVRS
jgi:hypothetical protein